MSPIEMCLPSPGASRVLVMSYFLDSVIANSPKLHTYDL